MVIHLTINMFFRIFADDYEIGPTWFISPSCLLIPLASQDPWNSGELVLDIGFLSSFFTKLHFFPHPRKLVICFYMIIFINIGI